MPENYTEDYFIKSFKNKSPEELTEIITSGEYQLHAIMAAKKLLKDRGVGANEIKQLGDKFSDNLASKSKQELFSIIKNEAAFTLTQRKAAIGVLRDKGADEYSIVNVSFDYLDLVSPETQRRIVESATKSVKRYGKSILGYGCFLLCWNLIFGIAMFFSEEGYFPYIMLLTICESMLYIFLGYKIKNAQDHRVNKHVWIATIMFSVGGILLWPNANYFLAVSLAIYGGYIVTKLKYLDSARI